MRIQNPLKLLRWRFFAKNSDWLILKYFRKKVTSYMFDWVLNMPLIYFTSESQKQAFYNSVATVKQLNIRKANIRNGLSNLPQAKYISHEDAYKKLIVRQMPYQIHSKSTSRLPSRMGPFVYYVRKIFPKTNISYPLILTCVSCSENFVYILNE